MSGQHGCCGSRIGDAGSRPGCGLPHGRGRSAPLAVALLLLSATAASASSPNFQVEGSTAGLVWASSFGEPAHAGTAAADAVFIIDPPVSLQLRELWTESVDAGEERVACLGGYYDQRSDAVRVTRLENVPSRADSLRSEAGPSLEKCGPPMWSGTAHTHIALYRGRPYATFSPNDRAVMAIWRHRWREEGLFCVLYTERLAYCEWGPQLSADVAYDEEPAPLLGGE